jgi:protein tyrosine/serine phosphatase
MASLCRPSFLLLPLVAGGCLPPRYHSWDSSSEARHVGNVHTVVPGVLIRGAQPGRRGLEELRDEFGVRTVVNFNNLSPASQARRVREVGGLAYLALPDNPFFEAGDRERQLAFLKVVRKAAAGEGGAVYVHCSTGTDRVGLAVGIYRIVEEGWDAGRALAELQRYQNYYFTVFFYRYPAILREVERDRERWRRDVAEMPDPSVQPPP